MAKQLTEQCLQLDVRLLSKHKLLVQNSNTTLTWSVGDCVHAQYDVLVSDDSMTLFNTGTTDIFQKINFYKHQNHLGCRKYFICEETGKHCDILYSVGGEFKSRAALKLAYESQSEQRLSRLFRKINKLNAKLEVNSFLSPCTFKPKGLHFLTWKKLQQERDELLNMVGQATVDRYDNAKTL